MKHKNNCPVCGGKRVKDFIRYDKRWGNSVAIFENVPAEVCPQCGEIWIDGKTLEKIEKVFLKGKKPSYTITVPVWHLKKAA